MQPRRQPLQVDVLRSREQHDRIVQQILPFVPTLPETQRLILQDAMRHPYGVTDDSLRRDLGLCVGTANSARKALVDKGFITDSRRRGITENGGNARIWVISVPPKLRR